MDLWAYKFGLYMGGSDCWETFALLYNRPQTRMVQTEYNAHCQIFELVGCFSIRHYSVLLGHDIRSKEDFLFQTKIVKWFDIGTKATESICE